jgi:DNA-binding IclR family transcriptional regulator
MVAGKDPKKDILGCLDKHPEGLTIQEIADITRLNRLTVSKYVAVLIAEGRFIERKVGSAKLCYLKRVKR